MSEQLKAGDKVKWKTSHGETVGEVEEKLISPTDIKGHHVAASKENPQYLVKSDKSGHVAAHKADSLEKLD
jgi:Hypervirulence associated proteins TUDOR domain